MSFFALVLDGQYCERCGRKKGQYARLTLMSRPSVFLIRAKSALAAFAFRNRASPLVAKTPRRLLRRVGHADDDTGGGPLI